MGRLRGCANVESSKHSLVKKGKDAQLPIKSSPEHNDNRINKSRLTVSPDVRRKVSQSAQQADSSRNVSAAGHDRDRLIVHASPTSVGKRQLEKSELEVKGMPDRSTKRKLGKAHICKVVIDIILCFAECKDIHFISLFS